ncbi:hypothetical protein M2390_002599 [Mycetocola sp. BIGb0189]|uniref:DUF3039 domain-containing protein n=1 Tax=Mycetocola sp. BIGb0189 TaxID=2940604 RepID=UPI002168386A|nr:DUF3039 domain-containing protein [Mycetocola sp. BIGb0189]MCS4277393.1 hypothetical protein [Mycetocola sp. BIGb0189]
MSTLLEEELVAVSTGEGVFTHIINCPEGKPSSEAWLLEARIDGLAVTALCGHVWVPQRDPQKYPVCEACLDAAGIIVAEVLG